MRLFVLEMTSTCERVVNTRRKPCCFACVLSLLVCCAAGDETALQLPLARGPAGAALQAVLQGRAFIPGLQDSGGLPLPVEEPSQERLPAALPRCQSRWPSLGKAPHRPVILPDFWVFLFFARSLFRRGKFILCSCLRVDGKCRFPAPGLRDEGG